MATLKVLHLCTELSIRDFVLGNGVLGNWSHLGVHKLGMNAGNDCLLVTALNFGLGEAKFLARLKSACLEL